MAQELQRQQNATELRGGGHAHTHQHGQHHASLP